MIRCGVETGNRCGRDPARVVPLWGRRAVVGLPYLFIRVAVHAGVDPVVVVWLRTAGGALVLLPLALRQRALRSVLRQWRTVVALTLVQVTGPFLLITIGEQHISSSLAGLLVAAEPLVVVVIVVVTALVRPGNNTGRERITALRVAGLLIGFTGVAALLGVDTESNQRFGAALVVMAAVLYAIGALLIRRVTEGPGGADPVGVITAILSINSLLLTPFALFRLPGRIPAPTVTASLLALALLCTAAAFLAYFALIAEVGPARNRRVLRRPSSNSHRRGHRPPRTADLHHTARPHAHCDRLLVRHQRQHTRQPRRTATPTIQLKFHKTLPVDIADRHDSTLPFGLEHQICWGNESAKVCICTYSQQTA